MSDDAGPPIPARIEITVAGHTVIVEAVAPLPEAAAMAYTLFMRTEGCAARSPIGFDIPAPDTGLAARTPPGPTRKETPMTGGWQGSNRRDELPTDWPELRRQVKERDHGICQQPDADGAATTPAGVRICGKPGTDVDHKIRGQDHSLGNLQMLCRACHGRKSAREGGQAFVPLHRPKPKHPALG